MPLFENSEKWHCVQLCVFHGIARIEKSAVEMQFFLHALCRWASSWDRHWTLIQFSKIYRSSSILSIVSMVSSRNMLISTPFSENSQFFTRIPWLCRLQELTADIKSRGRAAFIAALKDCDDKLEEERLKVAEAARLGKGVAADGEIAPASEGANNWTAEHLQLLIKAVNMFPAGTVDRWVTMCVLKASLSTLCTFRRRSEAQNILLNLSSTSVMLLSVWAAAASRREGSGIRLGCSRSER